MNISVAQVIADASARLAGGRHKAEADPRETSVMPVALGRHLAERTVESRLVDAHDAATLLADLSPMWSPHDLLTHPEIAEMAISDAEHLLTQSRDALKGPVWQTRAERMLLDKRLLEVRLAADCLRDVASLALVGDG